MKQAWFKFFNGANIFLALICLLTGVYIQNMIVNLSSESRQDIAEVRILDVEKTSYGQLQYKIWLNSSVWKVTSVKYLKLGKVYTVSLDAKSYTFNSNKRFETYNLSYGILGEGKITKILEESATCDEICSGLNFLESLRVYSQNQYFQTFCNEFKNVVNILLANRCKDLSTLSYGLVLGGNSDFSDQSKTGFKRLGLSHLVAVSGFQVVLLINFVESWLTKIPSRKIKWLTSNLILLIFILLVGPDPPVLRSGISVAISAMALSFLGRKLSSSRALIYSALIMLWINPYYIYSLSFQLSFLASFGLMQTSKVLPKIKTSWLANLVENLLTSLMAYLFTLPIILNLNQSTSIISIILNTIIAPIVPVVTIFNIFGLMPIIGNFILIFSGLWQIGFLWIIDFLSGLSLVDIGSIGGLEMLGYYIFLLILITLISKIVKKNGLQELTTSNSIYS